MRVARAKQDYSRPTLSISIALASFNGGAFLPAQLHSLLAQRLRPDEIVVSDDGSTDQTVAIIEDFARQAPFPVRLHRNPSRLGWRANFIRAASLCHHALIAFCDQDDIWYEDKLTEVEARFSDPDTLLAHHNAHLINSHGDRLGLLEAAGAYPDHQERLSRPTPWANPLGLTMTFRRSLLAFLPLWERSADHTRLDTPAAHDQFLYRLAINLGSVRYIARPLLAYRQHDQNAVGFARKSDRTWSGMLVNHHMTLDARMLARFCDILAAARASDPGPLADGLDEALQRNRLYLQQVEASEEARTQPSLARRAKRFIQLLHLDAASSGQWRLGCKRLIATGTLGVFLGR